MSDFRSDHGFKWIKCPCCGGRIKVSITQAINLEVIAIVKPKKNKEKT